MERRGQAGAGRSWLTDGVFTPKLVTCLAEGYGADGFRADAIAGLTVAIVALPLAMALAIASGASPYQGLVTAIVAGFLISALGGSRLQVGGPTGAFVVVVHQVIADHGYDGLILATVIAGILLVLLGVARLGVVMKYIPQPVIAGFTAGIGVIILTSQLAAFAGIPDADMPADVLGRLVALAGSIDAVSPATLGVGLASLAAILVLRRLRPGWPVFLIAVGLAAVFVALGGLPVPTIEDRFGALPSGLPAPALPDFSLEKVRAVMPAALTIALLAGIESLLSAVIADGMAGTRHRSNCELVAQGLANIGSGLFGGLPATGAIARTVTNVKSGGRTPVAGMIHAVALLLILAVAGGLAGRFPMPALAAVLLVVAWSMMDVPHVWRLLRGPAGDRMVLIVTFVLTVLVDITVAVQVGVVLSALLFMRRMGQAVTIEHRPLIPDDLPDGESRLARADRADGVALPSDVILFRVSGPFFFGAAWRLRDALKPSGGRLRAVVLDLSDVPFIDATGASALEDMATRLSRAGVPTVLVAVPPSVAADIDRLTTLSLNPAVRRVPDLATAAAGLSEDGRVPAR